ncbi:MAG: hypothetical protein LBP24_03605 [Coriobacteriales bacterium]|jgi:hypothetical protein|nr:hypothetical protein [Coriobacteriales bacterium]
MSISDSKVSDEEYRTLAKLYRNYGTAAEAQLDQHCKRLEAFCESGVVSGQPYDNLRLLVENTKLLRGKLSQIIEGIAIHCERRIVLDSMYLDALHAAMKLRMLESMPIDPQLAAGYAAQIKLIGGHTEFSDAVEYIESEFESSRKSFRSELEAFNAVLAGLAQEMTGLFSTTESLLQNIPALLAQAGQVGKKRVDGLDTLEGDTDS